MNKSVEFDKWTLELIDTFRTEMAPQLNFSQAVRLLIDRGIKRVTESEDDLQLPAPPSPAQ